MTKAAKAKNRAVNTPLMKIACRKYQVLYWEYSTHSFRLTKEGFQTVDYFPSSNRCFFHEQDHPNEDCWGDVTDVTGFIKFQFTPKPKP